MFDRFYFRIAKATRGLRGPISNVFPNREGVVQQLKIDVAWAFEVDGAVEAPEHLPWGRTPFSERGRWNAFA